MAEYLAIHPTHPQPRLVKRVAEAVRPALGEPLLSATLSLPGEALPLSEGAEIRERLERRLDVIVDGGPCGVQPSTVIDLTGDEPTVVREGKGALTPFLVQPV